MDSGFISTTFMTQLRHVYNPKKTRVNELLTSSESGPLSWPAESGWSKYSVMKDGLLKT